MGGTYLFSFFTLAFSLLSFSFCPPLAPLALHIIPSKHICFVSYPPSRSLTLKAKQKERSLHERKRLQMMADPLLLPLRTQDWLFVIISFRESSGGKRRGMAGSDSNGRAIAIPLLPESS